MSIEKLHGLYETVNAHLVKNVQGFNPDANGVSNDPAEDLLDWAINQVEKANVLCQKQETIAQGFAVLADTHRIVGNFLLQQQSIGKNYGAKNTSLPEFSDPNQIDISTETWGNGYEQTAKPGNPHYLAKAESPEEEDAAWANDPEWDERQDLSPLNNPAALERKIMKQAGININPADIGRETPQNTTFTGSMQDIDKLRGLAGGVVNATGRASRNDVNIRPG